MTPKFYKDHAYGGSSYFVIYDSKKCYYVDKNGVMSWPYKTAIEWVEKGYYKEVTRASLLSPSKVANRTTSEPIRFRMTNEIMRITAHGHTWFRYEDDDCYCVTCDTWPCTETNAQHTHGFERTLNLG